MALLSLEIPEVMAAKKPPLVSFFSGVPIVFADFKDKTHSSGGNQKCLQNNEIPKGQKKRGEEEKMKKRELGFDDCEEEKGFREGN